MESSWRRAWQDTERFRHTAGSFWGLEIVGASMLGFGGGYLGFLWTPANATLKQSFVYPAIGGAIGIIVGLVIVFCLLYMVNLFRAPYKQRDEARAEIERGQNESKKKIDQLQSELDDIKNGRPNVEFDSVSPATAQFRYFIRLVFRNNVKAPHGEVSTAKGTSARIEVSVNDNCIVDSWDGRWAQTNVPESYEDIWVKNKCDIQANDKAILDIGFRIEGQLQFQGHDNRHVSYIRPLRELLNPNSYNIRVELRASNMGVKEFWFTLHIPNKPQSNDLNQVQIKPINQKPAIHKVNSQK